MWQTLLDILFPRRSLSGIDGEWVTPQEIHAMKSTPLIIDTPTLRAQGCLSIDRVVAAGSYDASPYLRMAIHRFKYGKVRAFDEIFGHMLAEATPFLQTDARDTVLCPVPLFWLRLYQRGFNQSDLLATAVAYESGKIVLPLLTRIRSTGSQAKRNGEERRRAMHDAFACITDVPPSSVILVDDVFTTGATLDACAQALKKAGVARVEGLVIALG